VRDVVRAYRLLMEHGEPGAVYNVCRGQAVSVKEIADLLLSMAARPMHLVSDPALQRPVDIPILVGDNGALRRVTGWEPTIPLEQTLADVLADWRSRLGC
jgi:GDP-4-dehydro-6-deoxy-D-mannose reductase